MTDREIADIVCRALLAIVAALRKRWNLPAYRDIVIVIADRPDDVRIVTKEG